MEDRTLGASGAGETTEAPLIDSASTELSRDQVMNDIMNTSVMAALVGGFALSNMDSSAWRFDSHLDTTLYVLTTVAVHACTCSALTSAFVYRHLNNMDEDGFVFWYASKFNKMICKAPLIKFVMGVIAYMTSVIVKTWIQGDGFFHVQIMTSGIGVMSVMSALSIMLELQRGHQMPKKRPR